MASGYYDRHNKVFVSDEEAYDYALDKFINGSEEEKTELVELYFSGDWVRV